MPMRTLWLLAMYPTDDTNKPCCLPVQERRTIHWRRSLSAGENAGFVQHLFSLDALCSYSGRPLSSAVRQLISALHIDHTSHMRYGDLTFREIQHKAGAGWLAVVPTGCTEQQGPHLPVDFDTWFAETIMLAAAKHAAEHYDVRALVLPALPFGPTPEHRNFGSGYIDVPLAVHNALVHAILVSLARQGFQRIVVWRGCGGHDLRDVVNQFNVEYAGQAQVVLPVPPYHQI
jgi:hypothetical protein